MSTKLWNDKIKRIEIYKKSDGTIVDTFIADDAISISPHNTFYLKGEEIYKYDERKYYYKSFEREKIDIKKEDEGISDNVKKALEIAYRYGLETESEQKAWIIDQMVRTLCETEENYKKFVDSYEEPLDDDGNYHVWNTGIAP